MSDKQFAYRKTESSQNNDFFKLQKSFKTSFSRNEDRYHIKNNILKKYEIGI